MPTVTKERDLVADGLAALPEASTFTTLSKSSLYAMMERGELPYVVIGRRRMIPRKALIELARAGLRTGAAK